MVRENAVQRVVAWLREGYPTGVPDTDYVALLALLRRRLTDEEIQDVVDDLRNGFPDGDATRLDVHQAIERLTEQPPLAGDISRVSSVLAAVGWPLAALEDDEV